MRVRVWCEFLRPSDVCRNYILSLFKKYDVTLNYKLEYMNLDEEFFNMVRLYNIKGIPLSIWATLSDDFGYWVNEDNVDKFGDYVYNLIKTIEKKGLSIQGLCIDMEPPYYLIQKLYNPRSIFDKFIFYTTLATKNLNVKKYRAAADRLKEIALSLSDKGIESYVPVTREVYYDIKCNTDFIQNALETPVFEIPWDSYNLMYYATTMRRYLKGFESNDVDYLIYRQVKFMNEKLNGRVSVSAGLANTGKLGNEHCYNDIDDFCHDIGVLKACGIEDISIFSLDGLLQEKKLESFIRGTIECAPVVPKVSRKVIDDENKNKRLMNIAKAYYKIF